MSTNDCNCTGPKGSSSVSPAKVVSGSDSTACDQDNNAVNTPIPCSGCGGGNCYTSLCDCRLENLPCATRIDLIGVDGKCMHRFPTDKPGILVGDGNGGFVYTANPGLDLPQLVAYMQSNGQIIVDGNGDAIEGAPPDFPYVMVQLEDGSWKKLRGQPGVPGVISWDGNAFCFIDFSSANIAVSDPGESSDEGNVAGFDEDGNFVTLQADFSGVLYYDSTTETTRVTALCDVFSSIAGVDTVPFLMACGNDTPVQFVGGEYPGVTVWTPEGFRVVEINEKDCDPDCGCASELILRYDCTTEEFTIEAASTHVLLFRTNANTGSDIQLNFDLPWPAMVSVFAGRRINPVAGALDLAVCDIVVDGSIATAPSDGGMVVRLDNATSNTGVAILPLQKGAHHARIVNTSVTNSATPQWAGGWIKILAHKIHECHPVRPSVGGGVVREAYGYVGPGNEDCDCPPGPDGPQGEQGIQGLPGPAGPPGVSGDGMHAFQLVPIHSGGTVQLYVRYGLVEAPNQIANIDGVHMFTSSSTIPTYNGSPGLLDHPYGFTATAAVVGAGDTVGVWLVYRNQLQGVSNPGGDSSDGLGMLDSSVLKYTGGYMAPGNCAGDCDVITSTTYTNATQQDAMQRNLGSHSCMFIGSITVSGDGSSSTVRQWRQSDIFIPTFTCLNIPPTP